MKTPTVEEVLTALRRRGFVNSTRNECVEAQAMGLSVGRRVRVWVTDEETPGGYLRAEVMIETSNGGFETVATFNSWAPLDMVVGCAVQCTKTKF
jgi:hypothetical protein